MKFIRKNFMVFLVLQITFLILFTSRGVQAACSSDNSWDCGDDQCIDLDLLCNGKVDCNNGFDETAEICSALPCPRFGFRCSYGACIPGSGKCDKIQNCADNSDESPEMCSQ